MQQWVCVLALFQLLFLLAFTTPNLGIRADHLAPTGDNIDKIIQSYSGIITFDDGTIPLDKTKMTDAKLLHLCVLAYNEMISIWRPRNLRSAALPGAMAAIAYKDNLFCLFRPCTIEGYRVEKHSTGFRQAIYERCFGVRLR